MQLLQGPVVGLSHKLSGGRDVSLGDEQAAQPDLQVLGTHATENVVLY